MRTTIQPENIVYADHLILGEVILAANVWSDIEVYDCSPDEVKMIRELHDVTTSDFKGLEETIVLIYIKGEPKQVFFKHGCNDHK